MAPGRHKSLNINNLQNCQAQKNPLPATQGRGMTANNKPKPRLIHPQPLPCQEHSQHDR